MLGALIFSLVASIASGILNRKDPNSRVTFGTVLGFFILYFILKFVLGVMFNGNIGLW